MINQLQQNISQSLNPLIANAITNGNIIENVSLNVGKNVVNHGLNRNLQGWLPIRWQGSWAQIYDLQNLNNSPSKNLILVSNSVVTINLYVF